MIKNWLKDEYINEFRDYENSISNPFTILDNDERLEYLTKVLAPDEQLELISHTEIINVLTEMRSRQENGKSLWQRFQYKTGSKSRNLSVPCPQLKSFFMNYLCSFINKREAHSCCHGAEKVWSPKKSLESHLPIKRALSFDLSSAFENTTLNYVFGFFFDAIDGNSPYETRRDVAGFLARISTVRYEHERALPQGSTHSNHLFNRILYPLDSMIHNQAQVRGMKYSRWVDDFTISSAGSEDAAAFLGSIELVMQYFPISPTKSFFQVNDSTNEHSRVYLLGHIIHGAEITKNSKEKRDMYKVNPLDLDELFLNKRYGWC